MPNPPREPTNLVLEQLRLMRAETNERFNKIDAEFVKVNAEFVKVNAEIADLKKDLRGLKLNTIAEVYKANLTVASFADHERRLQLLEQKR